MDMWFLRAYSSLIFTRMGKTMEILLARATTAWNKWEIEAMILTSLLLQSVLTISGNIRKYSSRKGLNIGVWIAYQLSNMLSINSLSVLHNNVLWIPFFVLHLGGPDTITVYALEDNELRARYTSAFIIYLALALYVYLQVSAVTVPYFVVFPMFVAGGVKTLERSLAMWYASGKSLREFSFNRADPGPNYARYMEEYSLKQDEGYEVPVERFKETPILADLPVPANVMIPDAKTLQTADTFFQTFKLLFAGLDLSKEHKFKSKSFFQGASFEDAFKVIEVELGFMYDLFYTKAFIIFSQWGGLLHLSSLISTFSALWIFMSFKKNAFSKADVLITYVLVGGTIILEIYGAWVLLTSDWTMLWLSRRKNACVDLLYRAISSIRSVRNKRWSNTMAQYNLIKYCLRDKPAMYGGIQKFSCINRLLEKNLWTAHIIRYQDHSAEVSMELKKLIFEQLLEKSTSVKYPKDCKELCVGDRVLNFAECLDEVSDEDRKTLKGSVEVEFDQSILMWHIATNLRYNNDRNYDLNTTQNYVSWTNCEASKLLSNYMLYLLVICPSLLPDGIEKIRFQDTCAEAIEFFEEKTSVSDVNQACTKLLEVTTDISPLKVRGDTSKSVLFDGCRLAKSLRGLDIEKRWELICNVWVEMLCSAACKCRWKNHAKQLTGGGELLTHVWLLMAHLGIVDHF